MNETDLELEDSKESVSDAMDEGIRLAGGRNAGHSLSGFRLSGAREGVSLTETAAKISGAVFTGCEAGVRGNQKSTVTVDNCTFDGNADGAFLSFGGEGVFRDCRFINVRGNGIVVDKGAVLRVSGSTFSHGKTGVFSLTNSIAFIKITITVALRTSLLLLENNAINEMKSTAADAMNKPLNGTVTA